MCVPNLVPIGPQAMACRPPIPSEGYTHRHTLSYIDIDYIGLYNIMSRIYSMYLTQSEN